MTSLGHIFLEVFKKSEILKNVVSERWFTDSRLFCSKHILWVHVRTASVCIVRIVPKGMNNFIAQ